MYNNFREHKLFRLSTKRRSSRAKRAILMVSKHTPRIAMKNRLAPRARRETAARRFTFSGDVFPARNAGRAFIAP